MKRYRGYFVKLSSFLFAFIGIIFSNSTCADTSSIYYPEKIGKEIIFCLEGQQRDTIIPNTIRYISVEEQNLICELIKEYLIKKEGVTIKNGKLFCSVEVLGMNGTRLKPIVYIDASIVEFYLADNVIKRGFYSHVEAALYLNNENKSYKVSHHFFPRNSAGDFDDANKIFPPEVIQKIKLRNREIVNLNVVMRNYEFNKSVECYFSNIKNK